MDAILNFVASTFAFGAMYLFGRLTAQRGNYRDGHRDGYREGLEYCMRTIRIAQDESKRQEKVKPCAPNPKLALPCAGRT